MNIAGIITNDCANGVGIRVSVFVSGCLNHCKGCFQPETWDFEYGYPYSKEREKYIVDEVSKEYYDGITILGGDPMELCNQPTVRQLIEVIPKNKTIWLYTGYLYDKDLVVGGKRYIDGITDAILERLEVLVDGPFIEEKKNLLLSFRGSTNQRLIDMQSTLKSGSVVLSDIQDR